ncbi:MULTISPECIES: LLM class flavin-dependent oxidoreductase [unclassified Variovorax]|uniref:LLM class flavin-dependent oxidoreductase n=1 Tax=unclassified Variovorax TaxID=663243 RepID=UPI00076BE151|nr:MULTISPECIES: LLM class flavin-dependent oxidoreductase [unclassified Variovorax]KWT73922.1 luciferase-like protein [Variovorax sp. WDL1]PNG52259.1 Limonene 1,2-monooxygenase [Variovorax sp. B4]PNG54799.1 Limonene 1,2-monooxygenase [Variovorax sp. B2]VTV15801.1 Limonene 1,2-monooxygenase [Variovorax sp. WDL1]
MDLGFFTMPLHPLARNYPDTLDEDRQAIILADQLGFKEAFVGEHVTDLSEPISSSLMFLASLASDTRQIRLGSGTVNLPNNHPVAVAAQVAMLDNLLRGRFLLGIGPGGLKSDSEAFGNLDEDRTAMFVESIDHILAMWQDEAPIVREGKYWTIRMDRTYVRELGQGMMLRPYQNRIPEIFATVVAPYSKGIVAAAERGWLPITGDMLQPVWKATHWPLYEKGCQNVGRVADRQDWRVAVNIFVNDDAATARRYGGSADGPYGQRWESLRTRFVFNGRMDLFKPDLKMPDSAIDAQYLADTLTISGTPEAVAEKLLAHHDALGGFGTVLYVGADWMDPKLARRSMELMATRVMPMVNAALSDREPRTGTHG